MKRAGSIPFSALPGYGALFDDFMSRPDRVRSLYRWNFRSDADWKAVREARRIEHRGALAEILADQNRAIGASESTLASIDELRRDSTYVVTTGQQLSIYGGSLFYFYKTITVIQLARRLEQRLGCRVVPVFWMEGEDHDAAEVDHLALPGTTLRLEGFDSSRISVGARPLPDTIRTFHEAVGTALPATEFAPSLLAELAGIYQAGIPWADAFGRLWTRLFPGLVMLNPSDPRLKRLAAPVFLNEINRRERIVATLERRDGEIASLGHELQARTSWPSFFWIEGGERRQVEVIAGSLVAKLDSDSAPIDPKRAESFSPKVLLRPVVQDFLLPNLATVVGPGEISYMAQADALFEAHGIVPSILYPRAMATLCEKPAAKLLDSGGLTLDQLAAGAQAVFERVKPAHPEEAMFERAAGELAALDAALRPIAADLDPTLTGAIETAREKLTYQLTNMKGKFTRARFQREDVLSRRIEAACSSCFPEGQLQERVTAGIYFMAKYGPRFIEDMAATLDIGAEAHQVIVLD